MKKQEVKSSSIAGPIIALLVLGVLVIIVGMFSLNPLGKAAGSYFCDDTTASGRCSTVNSGMLCYRGNLVPAPACVLGKTMPVDQSCGDNSMNLDETDIDCGGTYCPGCGAGKRCLKDSDCGSNVCMGRRCASR